MLNASNNSSALLRSALLSLAEGVPPCTERQAAVETVLEVHREEGGAYGWMAGRGALSFTPPLPVFPAHETVILPRL